MKLGCNKLGYNKNSVIITILVWLVGLVNYLQNFSVIANKPGYNEQKVA